ncbi:unnamed protein product [Lactuca saligna]|uniref:Uncharacterized protein n=1 Tax=Lactuca saligna TaxID=75948 RepID=A0AA35Z485_LACSI|nr:unnamed protein product [Lactuca saligna]
MAHKPHHSPEQSGKFSPKGISKITRKPQLNRQGVVICEIPTPVSPTSKKRIAKDLVKKIAKNKRRKVIEDSLGEVVPKLSLHDTYMGVPSPMRDSPIKSNFEEIGNPGGSVKASDIDTTTTQGNPPFITSSTFERSNVGTSTSLPPFHSTISTSTHSPTFENILNQPITSLFSSQSTEPKTVQEEDTTKDNDFIRMFADITFDPEEENIPNHMLMSRKKFKILNRKLNSLL